MGLLARLAKILTNFLRRKTRFLQDFLFLPKTLLMTEQWWVFLHLCKQASHYFDIMTARHKSAAYRPHARSKKSKHLKSRYIYDLYVLQKVGKYFTSRRKPVI